jgi:hypothetical protein
MSMAPSTPGAHLEDVPGEEEMRAAVDSYVAHQPGSELARHVLWLLRPRSAVLRCYEISRQATNVEDRRSAVELLRVIADRQALPWAAEYLRDEDDLVQAWGIGVVDQLLWSELIEPEEAEELLCAAEQHPNGVVREKARFIRDFLHDRAAAD